MKLFLIIDFVSGLFFLFISVIIFIYSGISKTFSEIFQMNVPSYEMCRDLNYRKERGKYGDDFRFML